jgi:hypothetical protein
LCCGQIKAEWRYREWLRQYKAAYRIQRFVRHTKGRRIYEVATTVSDLN